MVVLVDVVVVVVAPVVVVVDAAVVVVVEVVVLLLPVEDVQPYIRATNMIAIAINETTIILFFMFLPPKVI